ncbi:MAG TPA: aldo/keto reductase [Paracoccus sp. (in: a-proteobacteria)]|uniref:aldo/keto reductase n=1 Tax=Paracoccus sp. TaxID=267 RepID=UPI002D0888C7|nr:aldo/keto reductase [Paracoccus sp. (in: a-proteobacteria)]HWL55601.1 aldo/keto reductase [Paracoccus sp. (in: a-proteobacteria)]
MVEYRYLGRSALKVSPITLGTMMFGGPTPDDVAFRIIDKAREQGINFIDTADVYHDGASETTVGKGIAKHRDHWVVATKFTNSKTVGPNLGGQSRKWIIQNVEGQLKRLNTDYIDLLYFHRAIFDAPLEEPLRAIGDLIQQGKLRYFGVSNFRAWRIAEVAHLADKLGIDRPIASQPLYNIVTRAAEREELPAASYFGLGAVTYSPLARGVLTGKYVPGEAPAADTRAGRGDKRLLETEWRPESVQIAHQVAEHARARGLTPTQFALAWVLENRLVTSTIAGPRTEEHWDGYVEALGTKLTAEDEALVDGLVTPGHASTHGFNDPSHPIEGRVSRGSGQEPAFLRARG